jgi:hypothetical protein
MARLSLVAMLILSDIALAQLKESAMAQHTDYRTVKVDGLTIFYRALYTGATERSYIPIGDR